MYIYRERERHIHKHIYICMYIYIHIYPSISIYIYLSLSLSISLSLSMYIYSQCIVLETNHGNARHLSETPSVRTGVGQPLIASRWVKGCRHGDPSICLLGAVFPFWCLRVVFILTCHACSIVLVILGVNVSLEVHHRHRSHFGSRKTLGCYTCAGLLRGFDPFCGRDKALRRQDICSLGSREVAFKLQSQSREAVYTIWHDMLGLCTTWYGSTWYDGMTSCHAAY